MHIKNRAFMGNRKMLKKEQFSIKSDYLTNSNPYISVLLFLKRNLNQLRSRMERRSIV